MTEEVKCFDSTSSCRTTSLKNRRVRSELQPRLKRDHAWTAIATQPDA